MKILADQNIPFAAEAFASLGEAQAVDGRALTPADVAACDILLIRSVTKIGPELLDGSSVKFVATATIGTDHVDQAYLADRGIGFSNAPGSNSRSVSEYVAAAIFRLASFEGFSVAGRRLGIVGVGNIGSKVAPWAEALGLDVRLCDPPLARQTGDARYRPFEELLDCDIITFHVPLTREGSDATRHMLNADTLAKLSPETILINACRGAVFDNAALLDAKRAGRPGSLVLDCWEIEPGYRAELLEHTAIGSAHIAGYSQEGKLLGTEMVQHAAVEFLNEGEPWDMVPHLPAPRTPELSLTREPGESDASVLSRAAAASYNIMEDDALLRETAGLDDDARAAAFDALRNGYGIRREFAGTTLTLSESTESLRPQLAALGFSLHT